MITRWRWTGTKGRDLHDALDAAVRLLGPVNSYLEIGVDGGGSLNTLLCTGVRPARIVLCDIWNPLYQGHGDTKPQVEQILAYFGVSAQFLDGDSKVTVPTLTETFDLITVDGDHSAEGAMTDLRQAWPLLRVGGLLAFDDVRHAEYPWLDRVLRLFLRKHPTAALLKESRGDCNAALVRKLA